MSEPADGWYRNRKGEPISREEFARLWSDQSYRRLAVTDAGHFLVMTIWNGIANRYGGPEPDMLFSSAILEKMQDGDGIASYAMERYYSTEAEALEGHAALVELASKVTVEPEDP